MDYLVTDTELTAVADAIRTKGNTSASLTWNDGFISAVGAISTGAEYGSQMVLVTGVKYYSEETQLDMDYVPAWALTSEGKPMFLPATEASGDSPRIPNGIEACYGSTIAFGVPSLIDGYITSESLREVSYSLDGSEFAPVPAEYYTYVDDANPFGEHLRLTIPDFGEMEEGAMPWIMVTWDVDETPS